MEALTTEGYEASVHNQYQWRQPEVRKEAMNQMPSYRNFGIPGFNKQLTLQDMNAMAISTGSNSLEMSKGMEKISEMNQLMAQHQIAQQRTLQALLY